MAQSTQVQREGVAQVAGRILIAWRNGESASLQQELEHARCLAAKIRSADAFAMATLEMERLEALSGAVESLRNGRRQAGAVRLLEHLADEHLAEAGARPAFPLPDASLRTPEVIQ
jgi:hypothetical protein